MKTDLKFDLTNYRERANKNLNIRLLEGVGSLQYSVAFLKEMIDRFSECKKLEVNIGKNDKGENVLTISEPYQEGFDYVCGEIIISPTEIAVTDLDDGAC